MRRDAVVVLAVSFLVSQGESAPAPDLSNRTTKDAETWLAEAFPKKITEIRKFPHLFVIRYRDCKRVEEGIDEQESIAIAAREVVFGNGGVTLKGVWFASWVTKRKENNSYVFWRTTQALDQIDVEFDRPVKRIADCEKGMLTYLKIDNLTIGVPRFFPPGAKPK